MRKISRQTAPGCSIYRVPRLVRQLKEEAYTPRVVSIGPYHYGHENLQAMEFHKTRYTQALFRRTTDPDLAYSECHKVVVSMEKVARHCYSGHDHDQTILGLEQGQLAEILLVDGCFILEILLRWKNQKNYSTDEILGNAWIVNCIQHDLVLLENQVPFFVLDYLFKIIQGGVRSSLQQLCVSFHLPLNFKTQEIEESDGVRHLLDIVRNYYLPPDANTTPQGDVTSDANTTRQDDVTLESIHCATKLEERGIKFRKGSTYHLYDFKFSGGVLEIPLLLIQDATESLLRNMIAFEQCCNGTSHHITSYAMLMDRLIDTPRDVEILEQKGIITNNLGSGKDVSQLINNMFKEVALRDFYYEALCKKVNKYYNRWWPKQRERLVRNYCSNPWRITSICAAFFILVLATIQTVYTVYSYYNPKK